MAFLNGTRHARVPKFEVVLELIGIHDAHHGDTVLLDDEVFLVQMRPLGQLAQLHACFSDGETLHHEWVCFSTCCPPCEA